MKKVINKNLSKSHHCKKVSPAKIKSILTLFKYLIDQKKENKEIALQFLHDNGIVHRGASFHFALCAATRRRSSRAPPAAAPQT